MDEGVDYTLYMHALLLNTNKPLKCAILSPDQELVLDGEDTMIPESRPASG